MYLIINKHSFISLIFLIFLVLPAKKLFSFPKYSSFLILDYNSGAILDGENEKLKMQPASLTKLMTLYIIFDSLEKNIITLSTKIPISCKASGMPASKLGLKAGKTIKVKDVINAMIVKSANDATYAIAEYLGNNDETNFVKQMNQIAKELELKNTNFANSTGLTHPNQYSTAYDLSILAKNIMLKFGKYYPLFSQKTFTWEKKVYKNTNHLLDYSNVDGLKTGYTYAAGFNLLVSSEINGFRIIITSLGNKSSDSRDNLVKQLVNNGLIIARNFRFSNINYKLPPQEIIAANNFLNSQENNKVATLINSNNDSESDLNINTYNNIIVNQEIDNPNKLLAANLNLNQEQKNNNFNNNTTNAQIYSASMNQTVNKQENIITYNKDYFIQIGVFLNKLNAKKIATKALFLNPKLTKQNLKIESINKKNNTLYRVRVNKLSNKDATKACFVLKKNNIACFIGKN